MQRGKTGGGANGGADEPALLAADPPPACLAALETVAEQASGNRVMLGPAAFSSGDELVLTRAIVRGPDGRPLDGRMPMPAPVVLKLSIAQGQCRIRQVPADTGSPAPAVPAEPPVAVRVGEAVALPACRCRAVAP